MIVDMIEEDMFDKIRLRARRRTINKKTTYSENYLISKHRSLVWNTPFSNCDVGIWTCGAPLGDVLPRVPQRPTSKDGVTINHAESRDCK